VLESAAAALSLLGCLSPESGQVFWRVPATASILEMVALVRDSQEVTGLKRARKSRLKKLHEGEGEEEEEDTREAVREEEEDEVGPAAAKRKKKAVVAEDEDDEAEPETTDVI